MNSHSIRTAVVILAFLTLLPLNGADSTGALQWSAAQFGDIQKDIASKMGDKKSGMLQLLTEKSYNAIVFYREVDGQAEIHEKLADFVIVRGGQGAILVGGKAVNAKPTTPGESRGDRVDGGTRYTVKTGDMVYIPANTPHQILVDKGTFMNAIVIKVQP
jgi:hypothetical protein